MEKDRYEGHLESKERFAIKKYLLIIGKKKNMLVSRYDKCLNVQGDYVEK